MNAGQVLAHYELVAEAPDAIARLRRFILDLAIRGKLVPQDSRDERGHALSTTSSSKPNRGPKTRPGTAAPHRVDTPYVLPSSWSWMTLGCVAEYGQAEKVDSNGAITPDTWVLDLEDIEKDTSRLIQRVSSSERPFQSSKTIFRKGDVLFGKLRPYLNKVLVADADGVCTTEIVPVRGIGMTYPGYLALVLRSPLTMDRIERLMYGMKMPRLGTSDAAALPVPIPPLAEQHRIVAKVDELMALCDRLEAARAQREATRDRLTASALARLNTSEPPASPDGDTPKASTFQSDARFALDTLPALTFRPEQIKQIRQTILGLAVSGRLVRQVLTEEPAQKLLKRVDEKRRDLLKAGYPNAEEARTQLQKQAEQTLPDGLAALPAGWAWATLMQCSALVIDCRNKTAPQVSSGIHLVRTTNIRDGQLNTLDPRYVDEATYEIWSSRSYPQAGDILITREAPMGEVCLIPAGVKLCLGQRIMLARLVPETLDPQFMIYSLRDPRLMERVQDKPIGATVQHLRVGGVETLLVPLPPREEQVRIVAKVDELMSLCDQLEASLACGENTRGRLLNALLHEALQPSHDNVIDFEAARQRRLNQRQAVTCRIMQRLAGKDGLGRVRAVKLQFLAEAHCSAALGGQWGRANFGPYDDWIRTFEIQAEAAGWVSTREYALPGGGTRIEYRPCSGLSAKAAEAADALGDMTQEFERVLDLFADLNTKDSEIATTLYAAWNDLLLEGRPVSDAAVIAEVREHWHPDKARFQPAQLQHWLAWLRTNRLVPKGQPPSTRHQQELL